METDPTLPPSATKGPWYRVLLFPALALLLVISWASGFVGIRFAADEAPVFVVLFWRCLMAGLILLPFALTIGPQMTRRMILEQAFVGALGMFIYLGGFALAIAYKVPTGLVALISDLVPLAIAALALPILGERLTARQWLGTFIGFLGVFVVSADSLRLGTAPGFAYALAVGAMISFAFASVLQKRFLRTTMPIHQSLALQCLTGAALFWLARLGHGGIAPPQTASFAFGISWLVILSTFLCYTVYYICLRLYPAAQVAAVIYLSPPATMLWAWAMFDEPLSAMMGLGVAITLIGVYFAIGRSSTKH
jgi:drug/metabolite transporter (DMT)-like permease